MWIFFGMLAVFFVPAILYLKLGWFRTLYHDVLGWHEPNKDRWYDGCSVHATCKHCGKEIMQDSQGNWFRKEDYE